MPAPGVAGFPADHSVGHLGACAARHSNGSCPFKSFLKRHIFSACICIVSYLFKKKKFKFSSTACFISYNDLDSYPNSFLIAVNLSWYYKPKLLVSGLDFSGRIFGWLVYFLSSSTPDIVF